MQVTETLNAGLKRELKIVVPAQELNEKLDSKIAQTKDRINIKGFRPGKVPASHIKKLHGKSLMAEIINEVLVSEVNKKIKEREERPTAEPEFKMTEDAAEAEKVLDGKGDLEVNVVYEVIPAIEMLDFSKIKIERPLTDTSDSDVEARLAELSASTRPYKEKEGKTIKAAKDDKAVISFIGRVDGQEFEGGKGENVELVLGSGQFIPGFEDQLIGLAKGKEKLVKVKFPEEYGNKSLAGKDAEFDVTLVTVMEPDAFEYDDEFAKKFGIDSLDKLKLALKGQIESQYGEFTRLKVKRQLLDALDDMYNFELPETLVGQEFDSIWKQVTLDLEAKGGTFGEGGEKSEDEARVEYKKIAERRVRLGLVLAEIGTKNDVKVSDQELQGAVVDQARQYPGQERQVIEYYQKNPQQMASLRAPIFEEKVVDYLIELAEVKDKIVSKEELMKQSDSDI